MRLCTLLSSVLVTLAVVAMPVAEDAAESVTNANPRACGGQLVGMLLGLTIPLWSGLKCTPTVADNFKVEDKCRCSLYTDHDCNKRSSLLNGPMYGKSVGKVVAYKCGYYPKG